MSSVPPSKPSQEAATASAILQALRDELRAAEARASQDGGPTAPASGLQQARDPLKQLTAELTERWTIKPRPFTSGAPLVGGLIVRFRTLWNEVSTRWYVDPLVQQQSDFNNAVLRLAQVLQAMQEEMHLVWEEAAHNDRRGLEVSRSLAQLDLVLKAVQEQQRQLQEQTEHSSLAALEARLTRLEGLLTQPASQATTPDTLQPPPPALPMDYFAFQERFRGSATAIKARQQPYVEYFRGREPVLDLGCGRGEFLELLKEAGVASRGIDSDASMVAYCRERGLPAEQGDLMPFLAGQPDASVGGIFAAQVIEHLPPSVLLALLQSAYAKLQPGGVLLLETINPLCLWALASSYTLDLTHAQPVHPETAAFLAESLGFDAVEIRYTSPVPEQAQLQPLAPLPDPQWEPWRQQLNENLQKLNNLLYTYQDYALMARKPA